MGNVKRSLRRRIPHQANGTELSKEHLKSDLVSAEVVLNKNGYPEVNGEDYGKTYQPVKQGAAPKKVVANKSESDEDEDTSDIPF